MSYEMLQVIKLVK